jgi:hypothetical protein
MSSGNGLRPRRNGWAQLMGFPNSCWPPVRSQRHCWRARVLVQMSHCDIVCGCVRARSDEHVRPLLEQIDAIDQNVTDLEKLVHAMDDYTVVLGAYVLVIFVCALGGSLRE